MCGTGWSLGWGMGWSMVPGWVWWLAIIGLFVWGVQLLSGSTQNVKTSGDKNESALELLKKRYVCGEIDRKEFEERKADLFGKMKI